MGKTNLQKWVAYMKKTSPGEVPTAEDAGKILSIGEDGTQVWIDPPQELPEIKDTDRDKVLVVDSNGVPTWGTTVGEDIPLGENESIGIFKE